MPLPPSASSPPPSLGFLPPRRGRDSADRRCQWGRRAAAGCVCGRRRRARPGAGGDGCGPQSRSHRRVRPGATAKRRRGWVRAAKARQVPAGGAPARPAPDPAGGAAKAGGRRPGAACSSGLQGGRGGGRSFTGGGGIDAGIGVGKSIGIGLSFRGGDMGGGSSSAGFAFGCFSSTKAGTIAAISRSGPVGAWCAGDGGGISGAGAGAGSGGGPGGSAAGGLSLFFGLPFFAAGGVSAIFCGGFPPPLSTMWMSLITLPPLHRSLQASLCGSNGPTMVIVLLLSSKEIVRILSQSARTIPGFRVNSCDRPRDVSTLKH